MLHIKPIVVALKRHKAGTVLIALQIALTLAIVCNALFIIQQRIGRLSRPTGMVESNLLAIQNRWVGVDDNATGPLIKSDLQALRQLAGVEDAISTNSFPLRGGGWSMGVRHDPDAKKPVSSAAIYAVDDHALSTMGAKLIAGRNFRSDEIVWVEQKAYAASPQIIITKALSDKLYPNGSALGKTVYITDTARPSTVIGIVEHLQVPWSGTWSDSFSDCVVLVPTQLTGNFGSYLIRSKPGQLAAITATAPRLLIKNNRLRTFSRDRGVRTFETVRAQAYKSDRGIALLMGVVCAMLLAITAAGIVGLTSFWVGQRRRQIGVRRALGATRHDILGYFLTENLLIGIAGVVIGALLAIGINLWMVTQFEMARLSMTYVAAGVVALLLLGQGAVLAPALRASRVSPVEATRSV
ncbi:FtsX-like permease family protein [Rhodanobacter glycinis]|uniref:ABC transporter permease n=1 Tax=Rhodanobacter glycinis TaxID=582702 RepID=UPI00112C3DF0|nr:FtsX-like permease family protein [Rhodanobacter glycinis]TPG47747.1 FtsX-like permease family protein [Rhodanobacter glycinis]